MADLTINGTSIAFPDSGQDPNWAPAVIQFAEQVEIALSKIGNSSDVAPQTLIIDADNPGTNIPIASLAFSTVLVRAATISYSVYRNTSTTTVYETGTLLAVYNANGTPGSLWEMQREFIGDGKITFSVTDSGQVRFSTTAIAGLNHVGRLGFSAQTLLQN